MLKENPLKSLPKTSQQIFLENCENHPHLKDLFDSGQREKAMRALRLSLNTSNYLDRFSEETLSKSYNLSRESIIKVVEQSMIKSDLNKVFSSWAMTTPDDAIYYCERVNKKEEVKQEPEGLIIEEVEDPTPKDEISVIDISVQKARFNARPNPYNIDFSTIDDICEVSKLTEDQRVVVISSLIAKDNDTFAVTTAKSLSRNLLRIPRMDRDFHKHLEAQSKKMYDEIGRGVINRLVIHPAMEEKISTIGDFQGNREEGVCLTKIGLLKDAEVYVAKKGLTPNDILCVYKNPDEDGDSSIVFGSFQEFALSLEYSYISVPGSSFCRLSDYLDIQTGYIRRIEVKSLN